MTFHCGCGRVLGLMEERGVPIPHRRFMWVALNAQCDTCFHRQHTAPVETCLGCNPPQAMAA